MGNLAVSFKRFFGNKNTVTIISVIAGILVLYIGYNWRVNEAIKPVSVPYAKVEIPSRTLITEDMIGYVDVAQNMLSKFNNIVTIENNIVNKYVSYGASLPVNSFFYKESIMDKAEMPDSAFADIPDGYTIYSLGVNQHTTYGNSIFPGNYIDLYFKAVDDNGKIIFGKMIESIEVLAVKDSSGQHVFETTVESRTPAELLFAVPDDMYLLLMKTSYLSGYSIEILPVPRNESYTANPGDTTVSSEYIVDFIESKAIDVPIDTTTKSSTKTKTNTTE